MHTALYVNDTEDPVASILKVQESRRVSSVLRVHVPLETSSDHRCCLRHPKHIVCTYITVKRFRISTTELMSKKRVSSFLAGRACRLSRTSYGWEWDARAKYELRKKNKKMKYYVRWRGENLYRKWRNDGDRGFRAVKKEGKLEVSWNSRNSLPTNLQWNSVGRRDRTSHITQSVISTRRSKSHDTEAQYHNTRKRKPSDRIQTRINACFCLLFQSLQWEDRERTNRLCFVPTISLFYKTNKNLTSSNTEGLYPSGIPTDLLLQSPFRNKRRPSNRNVKTARGNLILNTNITRPVLGGWDRGGSH